MIGLPLKVTLLSFQPLQALNSWNSSFVVLNRQCSLRGNQPISAFQFQLWNVLLLERAEKTWTKQILENISNLPCRYSRYCCYWLGLCLAQSGVHGLYLASWGECKQWHQLHFVLLVRGRFVFPALKCSRANLYFYITHSTCLLPVAFKVPRALCPSYCSVPSNRKLHQLRGQELLWPRLFGKLIQLLYVCFCSPD